MLNLSKNREIKVGLIGCGTIGSIIAKSIEEGKCGKISLIAIHDKYLEKSKILAQKMENKPKVINDIEQLINIKDITMIIETAHPNVVEKYAQKILESGKDLMIMSTGAFVDNKLKNKIYKIAKEKDKKIYIPSGAIAGIDGLKSASIGKIEKVELTTTKHPKSLKGAPYLKLNKISIDNIEKSKLIYEGSAKEACVSFPKNVNVAAILSLAGIGPEKTKVRIVADPNITSNTHHIKIIGEFGKLTITAENVPSVTNPKTSYLAMLSAIATLKKLTDPIQIGT